MRAMWTGTISFGLVSVPCKCYLAVDAIDTGAHLLHADCSGRVQMRTWCPTCEVTISRAETTRGFEVAKDRHVIVSDEEFDALPVSSLRQVSLDRFVDQREARSVTRFARATHYLEPEPLGRRAYALLHEVMSAAGLVGIGKVSFRSREHLAAIEPYGRTLLLTTLAWPIDIRSAADLDLGDPVDIPARERQLADQLVAAMAGPFESSAYHDEYRAALDALIATKVAGDAVFAAPEPSTGAMVDLMAALQASVAEAQARRPTSPSPADGLSAPVAPKPRKRNAA
jgi:DNA end-binding protein Ku